MAPPSAVDPLHHDGLLATLERARELGFLGPGPVEPHLRHALAYVVGVPAVPATAIDLGSGGGLPGLVLALVPEWSATHWSLVDAGERRCAFLAEAVTGLGLEGRVVVRRGRAEELGRDPELRGQHDLVTARSFAAPPVTAECAAPFLRVGGRLVVSEPPDGAQTSRRWPTDPLADLGLAFVDRVDTADGTVAVLEQRSACPDRFPRRVGVPAKRPWYAVDG